MSERIVIDPEVCGGRPIVAGTRMRVIDELDALAEKNAAFWKPAQRAAPGRGASDPTQT